VAADRYVLLDDLLADDAAPTTPAARRVAGTAPALGVPAWATGPSPTAPVGRATVTTSLELPAVDDPRPATDALGGRSAAWSAGYRDGHAEGWSAGHAEGLATGRAESAAAAIEEARAGVDALAHRVEAALAEQDHRLTALAGEVVDLAVELACLVVGHHVASLADPGAEALRRAVSAAPAGPPLLARLHPDDVVALDTDTATLAPGRRLEVVADPSVARGDCLLEAGPTLVDASLGAALDRVREVLTGEAP
jgi:flagellar assembly protein FliH